MFSSFSFAGNFITAKAGGKNVWYIEMNKPHAVYHKGKTYIAFHGGGSHFLDPLVISYDHKTGIVIGPVKVGENPLAKYPDNHGNPAIIVDDTGYIHVFYGGHGSYRGKMTHAVSREPGDISSWEHLDNINPLTTYPQLLKMSDGTIYFFYRAGNHRSNWAYVISTDNGRSFSREIQLLAAGQKRTDREYFNGEYHDAWYSSFYKDKYDTIHHVTRYHACTKYSDDPYHNRRRHNIYHLQMSHGIGRWTNLTGRQLTLPLTLEDADQHCLIFESDPKKGHSQLIHTLISGFTIGQNKKPHILFGSGRGNWGRIDQKWRLAIGTPWKGSWSIRKAPGEGQLSLEENGSLQIWSEQILNSRDGGQTWKVVTDLGKNRLGGISLVYDGVQRARIVAHDRRPKTKEGLRNQKIFLWGGTGFVTPRPYRDTDTL